MSKKFALMRDLTTKAKQSKFYLSILNKLMWAAIPFNKPHRFTIELIKDDEVRVTAKYRKKNLNHLRGIHACAIATIGEYASGVLLISNLDPAEYRLIMAKIEIDYVYQAKSSITAVASLSEQEKQKNILEPLQNEEAVFITMEVPIHDTQDNLIATVKVKWQIKLWKSVRTKQEITMEFLDTLHNVWAIVFQYKWLTFLVAFGAVSFLIYRIVDFLQYLHVNKFPKPGDLKINEEIFNKKRQRKGSRSMQLLWKGASSWGAQVVFIASIPFMVYWLNQKGVTDGYVYMILIGFSFVLNLMLSKLFPLWTPARPYACRAFQHEKAIQPGNMAFHFWGVVSWSVPVYFFWEYFKVNGWIGSVFFIVISQLVQVFIFIYSIKKSAIPYLEYPGLSDDFKKNMQKYLKEHGMQDSEVGVLRMNMGPNAFATSIGGYKQIVITEELIQGYKDPANPDFTLKLSEDTIEAITSHEVGHIRHHHVEKGIAMGILISSAVTIAVYHLFSADPSNYVLFKEETSQQLLLYWGQSIFNTMLVYPITFMMLFISRRKETQADTYLLNSNGCKNGKDFFHQIRHIAPVDNLGLWHSCNGTHPPAHEREKRMLEWEKEHCKQGKSPK